MLLRLPEASRRIESADENILPRQNSAGSFNGFAIRLGIGMVVAAQSMIFGLAINLEVQTPQIVKWGVQGII